MNTGSIFKSFHVSHQEYDHIDDFLLSFWYGDMWKVFNLYLKSKVYADDNPEMLQFVYLKGDSMPNYSQTIPFKKDNL